MDIFKSNHKMHLDFYFRFKISHDCEERTHKKDFVDYILYFIIVLMPLGFTVAVR